MSKYPISATFIDEITYDMPALNWSDNQWIKEFDNMQEVGIDTVVVMRGVFYDKCIYPSKIFPTLKEENEDFLGLIFREAEKRNMDVYLGLYISNLTWNDGDYKGEIEKNKLYVDEILSRYGEISSFKGWYIPHETANDVFNIKQTMGGLASLCKERTPDKKVLISPFFLGKGVFPEPLSPDQMAEEWDKIWSVCGKDIDYCAFQDGTVKLSDYDEYLSKMKVVADKHGITLWANAETFERDVRNSFPPIPFDVLRRKIEISQKYVEKIITFEFSHFLSPQSIYPSAKNLNALYRAYYENKK